MDKNSIELAKQGDLEAIATLIGNNLEQVRIAVYELNDSCLKLILEADRIPDRQKLVPLIYKTITSLETNLITKITLYGQKTGESFPNWNQELIIGTTEHQEELSNFDGDTSTHKINKNKFIKTLQTFKFASVVPYKQILNSNLYRSNIVKVLLFFGLFPLAISSFSATTTKLKDIAWILGIYYALVWGIVLYKLIKPTFSRKLTLQCVFFTAFLGIPLLIFVQQIPPFSFFYAGINSSNIVSKLIGYVLGVGVLEELCKGLPIYLFLLNPGKLKEPLTSAFYGAMSGLGFAIAEGVHYSLIYARNVSVGNLGITNHILLTTIRFISLPLFHAIWAGIVGYFIGLAAINPSRKKAIIFIGVAISAVLHGVYNTFSHNIIGLIVMAFSILLFVVYLRNSKEMIEEMQQFEDKFSKKSL